MAFWGGAQWDKRLFQLLIPMINPCVTAGKGIEIWNCHATRGYQKKDHLHIYSLWIELRFTMARECIKSGTWASFWKTLYGTARSDSYSCSTSQYISTNKNPVFQVLKETTGWYAAVIYTGLGNKDGRMRLAAWSPSQRRAPDMLQAVCEWGQ